MRPFTSAASSTALLLAAACASPPPSTSTPEPVVTPRVMDSVPVLTRPITWRGTLSPVQTRSGYASSPTVRTKTTGRVELESAGDNHSRTYARVTVTSPVTTSTYYRWAVLPGRCGGTGLPLVGYDAFPSIEVGSNGRGELSMESPVTMPSAGPLHVNIYSSGQQLSEVIACGNLSRDES